MAGVILIFGLHKLLVISRVSERLFASERDSAKEIRDIQSCIGSTWPEIYSKT